MPKILKGDFVGLGIITMVSLVALGYTDLRSRKIPNVILCEWLLTIIIYNIFIGTTNISSYVVLASTLVTGSFLLLRHIIPCSAGDFKLYGILILAMGLSDTIKILLLSLICLVLPLACGIRRVPLAFITCLGYIAFLLLKTEGIL